MLKKDKINIEKIFFWAIAAVLLLLLVQALWIKNDSSSFLKLPPIAASGIIGLVVVVSLLQLIKLRQIKAIDAVLTTYVLFALLSWFWAVNHEIYLKGLRYSVFAVGLFFVGRVLPLKDWPWERLLKFSLFVASGFAVLQLTLWLTGLDKLAELIGLGFEHMAGPWPRLQGSLSGPNQLATFLLIAALWLYWRRQLAHWLLALVAALMVLTFSRSALLGLLVGFCIPFLKIGSIQVRKKILFGLAFLLAVFVLTVALFEPVKQAFIESRHTELRMEIYANAIAKFKETSYWRLFLGHGPGTAGPATFYLEEGFITENWLLQITYEFGLVGLVTLLLAWALLAFRAGKVGEYAPLAIVAAVTVNSMYLHPLSDNALAALWFYLLLGLGYNIDDKTHRA